MVLLLLASAAIIGTMLLGASFVAINQCQFNPNMCSYPRYPTIYGPGIAVTTAQGAVKGVTCTSRMGKRFHAFMGIPYGEIPMRFEVSRPYPRWDGIRDATSYRPMCCQLDRRTQIISGSEDCLFLNVFTPQINSQLLPVMVWIDSSLGWQHGSGDKVNPQNFMDEPVVLLTFNFRQSALGFLSTGDGEVQGNMGLKDQVLALMWVKQNIHYFGGDPQRITVFGQDSGAASIHLHMLSPISKDLFHRAISQSGTVHSPWVFQKNSTGKAKILAQMLNCDLSTTKTMVACMRYKRSQEILEAELKLKTPNWNGMEPYAIFGPVVERIAYKSPAFLPDTPQNLISKGGFMKIPWIVGLTEDEGRYFVTKVLNSVICTNYINLNWNFLAPISYLYNEGTIIQSSKNTISSQIKAFYLGSKLVGIESRENYTNIYTDRLYLNGIVDTIKMHSSMSQVFPYIFKFKGDFTYTEMIMGDYSYKHAPSHFDELHYLFNWEWTKPSAMGSSSLEFSQKFVKLWVSFAETGIPRATWGTTSEWRPMSSLDTFVNWYIIDYDTHLMMDDSYTPRLDFWKRLAIVDDLLT